jgi:hypothetical protein
VNLAKVMAGSGQREATEVEILAITCLSRTESRATFPLRMTFFQLGIVNLAKVMAGGQREATEVEREAAQTFHLIHQVFFIFFI